MTYFGLTMEIDLHRARRGGHGGVLTTCAVDNPYDPKSSFKMLQKKKEKKIIHHPTGGGRAETPLRCSLVTDRLAMRSSAP